MELELKHLAPYLPFNLKIQMDREAQRWVYLTPTDILYHIKYQNKPLLIPMSDICEIFYLEKLLRYILPNPEDYLLSLSKIESRPGHKTWFIKVPSRYSDSYTTLRIFKKYSPEMKLSHYEFLISNHFDVFNLINTGLAIDINTLIFDIKSNIYTMNRRVEVDAKDVQICTSTVE